MGYCPLTPPSKLAPFLNPFLSQSFLHDITGAWQLRNYTQLNDMITPSTIEEDVASLFSLSRGSSSSSFEACSAGDPEWARSTVVTILRFHPAGRAVVRRCGFDLDSDGKLIHQGHQRTEIDHLSESWQKSFRLLESEYGKLRPAPPQIDDVAQTVQDCVDQRIQADERAKYNMRSVRAWLQREYRTYLNSSIVYYRLNNSRLITHATREEWYRQTQHFCLSKASDSAP